VAKVNKSLFRSALVLLLVFLVSSCPREPGEEVHYPPPPPKETTYRFPLPSDPPTLDPAHVTDTVSDSVVRRIFETLVKFSPEMKIVPLLAEKWDISEDGLVYKFYLRDGVKFHNGREVRAEDFVYSFTRILDKKTASERAQMLMSVLGAREFYDGKASSVKGLEAPDRLTFKITLKETFAPFLAVLTMSNFSVVPKEAVESASDFSQNPVGTGAFVFERWERDNQIVLKSNKAYWNGEPSIDVLIYRIIPNETTRYQAFLNGDLEHTDIPFGKMGEVRRSEKLSSMLQGVSAMDMYCYGFNVEKAPFNDKRVRLAFNYAVDKSNIIDNILEGRGEIQKTYLPPGMFYFNEQSQGYPYDIEKAQKYLEEAGYPKGKGFPVVTLTIDQQQLSRVMAEAIQEDLRKIGVRIEIEQNDWATLLERMYAGELAFHQNTWLADYPDPDNWLFVLLDSSQKGAPGNSTRFSNKEFDGYVRKARKTVDERERARLYRKAEDIALAEAPWLLSYWRKNYTLVQPYVKGLQITPLDRTPQLNNTPMERVVLEK